MKISILLLFCAVLCVRESALAETPQYRGSFTTAPAVFVFAANGLICPVPGGAF
jgi:hypothetical protein